jgi:hypothetical protein
MNEFDGFMLNSTPYFIARKYRQVVSSDSPEEKVYYGLQLYELTVRTLAIGLTLQYLVKDAKTFSSQEVNTLLEEKLPIATLDIWEEILFSILRTYAGRRNLLFMPELYDFYLDESITPPRERTDKRELFKRLIQIEADVNKAPSVDTSAIDWITTWQEVHKLLGQIFEGFRFLAQYRIIQPIQKIPGGYAIASYMGEEVVVGEKPLETSSNLEIRRLYLYKVDWKKEQEPLDLYPLFLILNLLPEKSAEFSDPDFAIYDRYAHNQIYYLITRLWEIVPNKMPVGEFVDLVFHTLQRVKQDQIKQTETLSWPQLSEIAYRITARRIANVLSKYQQELYLQRNDIISAFEDFLFSDKTGFILVGKSGVGKSNFLVSLLLEYQQKNPNVSFLMYNGAKLNPLEDIGAIITRDFDTYFRKRIPEAQSPDAIWHEINRVRNISECRLVVCIDAINENSNPKGVLERLDDLIQRSSWPWLKILVTCRTEAWKVLRRTVTLAEDCYYRALTDLDDADQLALEIGGFRYSEEIPKFDRYNELPRVYENYAEVFKVKTPFDKLSPNVKEIFRDPLVLRLIMTQFRKGSIPETVDLDYIYRDYTEHLLEHGYLQQRDLHFLLHEILPLMINEETFSNKVGANVIATHLVADGRRLFDLTHNNTILSSGDKVNSSFERLVSNEILAAPELSGVVSYDISFKYERFYDYFAGFRLGQFLCEHNYELVHCQRLLQSLRSSPFLWSATVNTLVQQVKELNIGFIVALSYSVNQTQRKVVSVALVEGTKTGDEGVKNYALAALRNVLEDKYQYKLPQFPTEQEIIGAKQIAVEVAAHLLSVDLLVIGGTDTNLSVRTSVAHHIEWLWRSQPEVAADILQKLGKMVSRKVLWIPIPDKNILDTVVGSTILVFIQNYRDASAISPLRKVIQEMVNTLLPFRLDSRLGKMISGFVYRRILFNIGLRFIQDIPDDQPMFIPANTEEIAAYFSLPQSHKDLMLEVLKLFYEENGSLYDNIGIIEAAVGVNDGNINWAIVHMLARRGIRDLSETASVIEHIFTIQINRPKPSYHAAFLLGVYGTVLRDSDEIELAKTLFPHFHELTKQYVAKTNCRVHYLREYITSPLGRYIETSYELLGKVDHDFVHDLISRAIENQDWYLLKAYSRHLAGLGTEYPALVLRILEPFLTTNNAMAIKELTYAIHKIRSVHPDLVEEYMVSTSVSATFKSFINLEATADVTESYQRGLEAWLLGAPRSDTLRDAMVLLLGQQASSRDDLDWYAKLFGFIINLVFEKPLLSIDIAPIDVGFKVLRNPWENR